MKVKVCGITNYDDAVMALEAGADALWFNFYAQSPRYIDPVQARSIIRKLPPFAVNVGLFVNQESPDEVSAIASRAGVQAIQLHGDESPDYCLCLPGWTLIKALRIGSGPLEEHLERYPVQAFLLDSRDDAAFGGTGKAFDWERARELRTVRPLILAGGLQPGNVREAILRVRPYALDVCSGVERAPGKKDPQRLTSFMNEVRNVEFPERP
jgi:phosphoribosylanthranilate isomerase